ncbi:MAG: hypothetical protein EBZ58_12820, partial [Bacteroidetes bacterium]|nr:hypothetical protein [Bacteroidota bacterium]
KNQLVSLPDTLPVGLIEIDCSHNRLTRLSNTLPTSLTHLYVSDNQLTTLPDTLPPALTSFFCNSNRLTTLPDTLPAGLTNLYCWNNNFPDREVNESIPEYVARVNAFAEKASKDRIVARCACVFEELAQTVWHPSRVERLMLLGMDMEDM